MTTVTRIRSPRRLPRLLLAVIAATLFTGVVGAQSDPVADALRRGNELRRAGRDEDAIHEFRAAYERAPDPRTAALYGLAAQATGRWLDADRLLREALAAVAHPWVDRNRATLEEALGDVARHVGRLEVLGGVAGASVRVDGRDAGVLPLAAAIRVAAGIVTVSVSATGFVTAERRVLVDPGATVREHVELTPAPDAPRADAPPIAPRDTAVVDARPTLAPRVDAGLPWRFAGYGALGLGGAAVVLGSVALALRDSAAAEYNGGCPRVGRSLSERCQSLVDDEARWSTTGYVALPVGAVLIGAGVLALWHGATLRRSSLACFPAPSGMGCAVRF